MSNTLHVVSECHILDVLHMIHERLREKKPLLWAAYRKHVNFHQDMNFKEHQPGKTCTYRGYSHTVDKPRMGLKNKPVIALQQWRPPCLIFSTLTQADQNSKPEFKAKMATVRMSGLGHTKHWSIAAVQCNLSTQSSQIFPTGTISYCMRTTPI